MTDTEVAPSISLARVAKSYGAVRAVRGVDLLVEAGETVALLGPNGAGKTTTLDMALGLVRPDSGQVTLFGLPPSRAIARGLVGGMLQTGVPLDYLRVRELIEVMASFYPTPRPTNEILELTGCATFQGQMTTGLSGGQAQRVRFAAALVGDPELLVLDEPTAALDVDGRREFWRAMRDVVAEQKTVVFATHNLEEADSHADRVVVINGGSIIADGTPSQIKATVGTKTIRMALPDIDLSELVTVAGVVNAQRHGLTVVLTCSDSDRALYELLDRYRSARDIEVIGGTLEEAFVALTSEEHG
ncbi:MULTISPECIES: ABC transporter ATP-binding protein [Ferrimicrobium]|uniref:ABC transporter ATP-binding protein n=1 Tax=Ferrimicrobium acidiphilum TaxID=121039 RepID=A0ABV3Y0Z9_9ACTN|nr:ABC transporter ATP-binding protein [Ferrimicrobium sp.]